MRKVGNLSSAGVPKWFTLRDCSSSGGIELVKVGIGTAVLVTSVVRLF